MGRGAVKAEARLTASSRDLDPALRKAEGDVLAEKYGLPTQRASEILCEKLAEKYIAEITAKIKNPQCKDSLSCKKKKKNPVPTAISPDTTTHARTKSGISIFIYTYSC